MQMNCPYCTPTNVWGASPQVMQELLEKHNKSHTLVSGLVASEPYTNTSLANPPKGHTPNTLEEKIDAIIMDNVMLGVDSGQAYFHDTDTAVDKIIALINDTVIAELEGLPRFTDLPSGSQVPIQVIAWHDVQDRIAKLRTHGASKNE